MKDDTLQLLLAHDDDGSPVLDGGLPDAASTEQVDNNNDPLPFWEEGGHPDDLEEQRWGVIAPEGPKGDRLLALIRPLIEARREAQGGEEVKVYRVPSRLLPAEAARWRKQYFDLGTEFSTDTPRYQLILGDLDDISLGLQQMQSSDGFVGRLSFRNDRGYEAYVDKVLRWEKARAEVDAGLKLYTVHDGTGATMIGYRALVKPGVDMLRSRGYDAADLGSREGPSPSEFLEAVKSPDPTILFSVSHGAGAPRGGWKSYEEQRARQGAMSFGREGKLAGGDIKEEPFLPGGLWFMLACYGAGTPNTGVYRIWLEKLKSVGQFGGQAQAVLASLPSRDQAPFIAALPQAVLANPNGPLAVIGHVDLAWTYSFEERDTGKAVSRPSKFMDLLRSAVRGDRVGISYRELVRFLAVINYEINEVHEESAQKGQSEVSDAARDGHLCMLRQDLAAYILLGDPATRLPIARKRKPQASSSAAATSGAGGAPTLPVDIEILEEAIGHILAGRGFNEVATEHSLDRLALKKLVEIYKKAGRAALGVK